MLKDISSSDPESSELVSSSLISIGKSCSRCSVCELDLVLLGCRFMCLPVVDTCCGVACLPVVDTCCGVARGFRVRDDPIIGRGMFEGRTDFCLALTGIGILDGLLVFLFFG